MTYFPSGVLVDQVRFTNTPTMMLFMVSGGIAAVSSIEIGIDYLGLNFRSKYGNSVQTENRSLVLQTAKYEVSKRIKGNISIDRDKRGRIHYRDANSGKFVKKNLLSYTN